MVDVSNFLTGAFDAGGQTVFASFLLDGQPVALRLSDFTPDGEGRYIRLFGALTVVLELTRHPEDHAAVWMLRFRNDSDCRTAQIAAIRTLDVTLQGEAILHTLDGDHMDGNNFLPNDRTLNETTGHVHLEPAGGRSSSVSAFPFFDVETAAGTMVCAVGWTGQWCLDAMGDGRSAHLTVGLADADLYLDPGENVRAASICVMCCPAGPDEARRTFRRFLRDHYSPQTEIGRFRLPLSLQNFDRYFWSVPAWRCEPMQLQHADIAGQIAEFDTYWLDAAWFKNGFPCGVGNYRMDDGFAANGLKKLSEAIHRNGMKFMVWFEPERVYETSDVWRDHRPYLLEGREEIPGDPKNSLYNLGDDEARAWLSDTLIRFIRDNGIDIYRQDFNMDPLPYWRYYDKPGKKGYTEMKDIEGLYQLWDDIRAAFPGILIDNCSSGGRRIDFETCCRSVPMWRSDTACFPESEDRPRYMWDQNQILSLTRYLPYHCSSAWDTDAYAMRSAFTSGLAVALCMEDEAAVARMKPALHEINALRDYFDGDFYPHGEPTLDPSAVLGWQYACGDCGAAYVFARPLAAAGSYTLRLDAINPEKTYQLTIRSEDRSIRTETVSGADLMERGYDLPVAGRQSYAVTYQTV